MIKLIQVNELGNSRFEIQFEYKGKLEKQVVTEEKHQIGDEGKFITLIVAEKAEFYDYWGQSSEFRKDVSEAIRAFSEKLQPELQTA